ncbi:hypothetical protein WCP94_000318 (plasmid) [Bilophila wadsworthia]
MTSKEHHCPIPTADVKPGPFGFTAWGHVAVGGFGNEEFPYPAFSSSPVP